MCFSPIAMHSSLSLKLKFQSEDVRINEPIIAIYQFKVPFFRGFECVRWFPILNQQVLLKE